MSFSLAAFSEPFISPPSEVQLIPYGKHSTGKGDFVLDREGAASIISDFNSRQNDMVLDYEHQTLTGSEAPAAGWIRKLINKGSEGIWAVVQWTPRAIEYLRNREYRYISPVFLKSASDGRVMRLINAALTNQPAIDGMVPVVNKQLKDEYPETEEKRKEERMEKLFELLGLKADATEEQAMEAVMSLKESTALREKEHAELLKALGLKEGASVSEATGTIEAFKQGHEGAGELVRKVTELEEKLRDKEASELVSAAMKAGKVTPAQKEWASAYAGRDPEGFRTFVAKAPVVVPVGPEFARVMEPHGKTVGAPDGIQLAVNKAMGIDAETFKKHSKTKEVS
jgi:phage I-like protein